jgi:hypothetical protein
VTPCARTGSPYRGDRCTEKGRVERSTLGVR